MTASHSVKAQELQQWIAGYQPTPGDEQVAEVVAAWLSAVLQAALQAALLQNCAQTIMILQWRQPITFMY